MLNYNKIIDAISNNEKVRITQKLLNNINFRDKSKMTMLAHAVNNENYFMTKKLLENGANPNLIDDVGNIPLNEAALFGYSDIVRILLEYKSLINHQNNNGETALSAASSNGYLGIVKLLIACYADIDLSDNMGTTPLKWAIAGNHQKVVEYLSSLLSSSKL